MAIRDIAFVAYSVADVPRSVAFYRDVVGLKPGQSFGEHRAEFDVGNMRLVSDPSGPHPYPSDYYYASNIPMLNAGRTYQAFLSQPSGTCTPLSLGSFST